MASLVVFVPIQAQSGPAACGGAISGTDVPEVRNCTFTFVGNPVRVRGYMVARGTNECLGVARCPADAFMDVRVFRGGPNLVYCAYAGTLAAACVKQKSLSGIAVGTQLTCGARAFNTATQDRRTQGNFRCTSGLTKT